MSQAPLQRLRDAIQEDVGRRGLKTDPTRNLVNTCADDFSRACLTLAETPYPRLAIVTGFYIPTAQPPAGETDGPLGAVFLARALVPLGIQVAIASDSFCMAALQAGLSACGLAHRATLVTLERASSQTVTPAKYWRKFQHVQGKDPTTHLLAIERVGPSHTLHSLQRQLGTEGALGEAYMDFLHTVPEEHQDRCHTMRGRDITDHMSPAHWLFEEAAKDKSIATIGIGDGGNEIGMGKMSWDIIHRNVPGGGLVACRVPTNHLIVCGVSNWGAYALAAGVKHVRGLRHDPDLFDPEQERRILQIMVEKGGLVDGVTGKRTATVDGLAWETYAQALRQIGDVVR